MDKDYRRQAEDISLTVLAGRSVDPVTSAVRYANPERLNPRSSDLRLGGVGAPRPLADPAPASFDNFSPKIGLKYQLTEDAQVYGNVSLGFKSGGFNGRLADAQLEPYDEETLTSYELGYKSEWLENRLRVNTAVFFNDYRDLQVSSFQSTPDGSALIGVFTNAGKASMQGLELELTALITDAFSITANLGYLDAEYDEFITASGGKLVDVSSEREMINAPRSCTKPRMGSGNSCWAAKTFPTNDTGPTPLTYRRFRALNWVTTIRHALFPCRPLSLFKRPLKPGAGYDTASPQRHTLGQDTDSATGYPPSQLR